MGGGLPVPLLRRAARVPARPLDDAAADAIYADAKKLGTTLQVRDQMWLTDRAAFDEYWKRSLDELRIDPPVREHLHGVASMVFCPGRCDW